MKLYFTEPESDVPHDSTLFNTSNNTSSRTVPHRENQGDAADPCLVESDDDDTEDDDDDEEPTSTVPPVQVTHI